MKEVNFKNRESFGKIGFINIFKIEISALKNNPQIIYQELLTPILFYLFFSITLAEVVGNVRILDKTISYEDYTFMGIISRLVFTGMSTTLYRVIIDRKYYLLSYKYLSGIGSFSYVLGMASIPVIIFLMQSILLYVVAAIINLKISFYLFLLSIVFGIVCQIFWCELGIFIALLTKNYKTRDIIMNVLLIPISYATPAFFIMEKAPKLIQIISKLNPLTYQLNAMRYISVGIFDLKIFIIPILLTIVFMLFVSNVLRVMEFNSKERK